MKSIIILILIAAIVFFVYRFISKRFKLPHLNAVNIVCGEIKGGKSITSLTLAKKDFKKRKFRIKVINAFNKLFNKPLEEEPLFYSNIPVGFDYVEVTEELLHRIKRFAYGSVVFLDEVSFTADKMIFKLPGEKGEEVRYDCKMFFKLFGHETGGYGPLGHGTLIANTQSISDCSKELRACIGSVYYVDHIASPFWLPIFALCYLRQERFSEDGTTINAYTEDLEKSMCKFLFRKKDFKSYDKACFSLFTDDLEVENKIIHGANLPHLKTKNIVSFDKSYNMGKMINEQKEN